MFIFMKNKSFESSIGSSKSCSDLNGYSICIDSPYPYFGPYQTFMMSLFCKNSQS